MLHGGSALVIAHNLSAQNAQRMYGVNNNRIVQAMEKLSSGYRINRSADDAAGLAISEKMRAQIRGLNRASLNALDGISVIQTAEGALGEMQAMLHRINELCTQAANDTNTDSDRAQIQQEIDQLVFEIDDGITQTTTFNTKKILMGTNYRDNTGKVDKSLKGEDGLLTYWDTRNGSIDRAGASGGDFNSFDADGNLNAKNISFTGLIYANGYGMFLPNQPPGYDRFMNTNMTDGATVQIDQSNGQKHQYVYIRGNTVPMDAGKPYMSFGEEREFIEKYVNPNNAAMGAEQIHYFDSIESLIMGVKTDFGKDLKKFDFNIKPDGSSFDINMTAWADQNEPLELRLQVGALPDQYIDISIDHLNARGLGINGLVVDTFEDAGKAMERVQDAIDKVSTARASLGAQQNRLEHTIKNLDNIAENTQAAESRIRDTDMAKMMVEYTRNQILAQVGEAMMANSRNLPEAVLQLLN